MGIYDREYYREETPQGVSLSGPKSITTTLILINVAIYVLDMFVGNHNDPQSYFQIRFMAMEIGSLAKPWMWWQSLTSGFAHDPYNVYHIIFNMLVLFFFGRTVEQKYGRSEFLRFYLVAIVFSSFAWAMFGRFILQYGPNASCLGASGAVSAVIILFALNFPRARVALFFLIPMPAWVAGIFWVVIDMFGMSTANSGVAHSAHLAGMAFAFVYWQTGVSFTRLMPSSKFLSRLKPGPRLRIHDPDRRDEELANEADRLLEKVHREGEESLTPKERKKLEAYSRRMKDKLK